MFGSTGAQTLKINPEEGSPMKPGTNTSFGALKQIDAGVLSVGYAEAGLPTAPHTQIPAPMPTNSRVSMHIGPSRAASGTICLRKPRGRLRKPWSMSTIFERISA
jgi:hypothetical protein